MKRRLFARVFAVCMAAMIFGAFVLGVVGPAEQRKAPSVISVGNRKVYLSALTVPEKAPQPERLELPKFASLEELMGMLRQNGVLYSSVEKQFAFSDFETVGTAPSAASTPVAEADAWDSKAALGGDSSSKTNTQVAGVDEGDVVKTDGKYIYVLNGKTLRIVEADGAKLREVSVIELGEDEYATELYVTDDKLVLVSVRHEYFEGEPGTVAKGGEEFGCCIWLPSRQFTGYTVYDIADRAAPSQIRHVEIEGGALATRMIDNTLYFVCNRYLSSVPLDDMGEGDILPVYNDSVVSEEPCVIPAEDISYFPGSTESSYLLVGAFDISSGVPVVVETYFGSGQTVYMSRGALYVTQTSYGSDDARVSTPQTQIYKFAVDETSVILQAKGNAVGTPIGQYSMDEYDSTFRIATSNWETGNYITVFDETMEEIGRTEALAKGEQIYASRFMGETAYLVTYFQVDPLFVVDLSDPAQPTVLGELKVPGFSQYLHPMGDGLLVGLGRHTLQSFVRVEGGKEEPAGTVDVGLKLSLFDVSDPQAPIELDTLLFGENTWAEAEYNPRAIMVDARRNGLGFALQKSAYQNDVWQDESGFVVVSVRDRHLVRDALLTQPLFGASRLCYIGETLYAVDEQGIKAYDYNSYNLTGSVEFH